MSAPLSDAKPTGDQRQLAGEAVGEFLLVGGGSGPGLLLAFTIVVAGQLLDAGAEDFRQHRRIGRQERPQRQIGVRARHHRFTFQVVVPSL